MKILTNEDHTGLPGQKAFAEALCPRQRAQIFTPLPVGANGRNQAGLVFFELSTTVGVIITSDRATSFFCISMFSRSSRGFPAQEKVTLPSTFDERPPTRRKK